MDRPNDIETFITSGLRSLGVETDDLEIKIMHRFEEVYGPARQALLETDLSTVEPEILLDPGSPPSNPAPSEEPRTKARRGKP